MVRPTVVANSLVDNTRPAKLCSELYHSHEGVQTRNENMQKKIADQRANWSRRYIQGLFAIVLATASSQILAAELGNVKLIAAPEGGFPIVARVDGAGAIHLLLDFPDGPKYGKSMDNGRTFSKLIHVVDDASRAPGLEYMSWDLAVTKSGQVHVALGTNAWKLKLPKEEWGFFHAVLDVNAGQFTALHNINRKPSEGFSLAADDHGRVAACWLSDKLFVNLSKDSGKLFGDSIEIDKNFDPCNCCTTSSAYGADGRLAILYREESGNERDMYVVVWDQERNQASRNRISQIRWKIETCPMTYYSITAVGDGYLAVWPTNGKIYFSHLNAEGALVNAHETETEGRNGMRSGMIALSGHDNSTLIAWNREGQLGWQRFDTTGSPLGTAGVTQTDGKGAAGVVTAKGEFLLFR